MQTVAVFFGGRSNEREISVITGIFAVNLLRTSFEVLPIYLDEENQMYLCLSARDVSKFAAEMAQRPLSKSFVPIQLEKGGLRIVKGNKLRKKISVDCALNCCHGGLGEGGGLSMLFRWFKIPSASPKAAPSQIFLDKALSKIFLKGAGIPVVPDYVLREEAWRASPEKSEEEIEKALSYPVIVKPSKLGSSIGIAVARDRSELKKALDLCFRLDDTALIEKYLQNKRDLNLAAYRKGKEIVFSETEEVFSSAPILSFEDKYEGTAKRTSQKPAQISSEQAAQMQAVLQKIFDCFDISGIVRADFLLSGDELYFNELNTVPGTLAAYLFSESLAKEKQLLCAVIQNAVEEKESDKEIINSGVLSRQNFGSKRAKMPF